MDGKDLCGNSVRPRILDTDEEFIIYKLLYNILNDPEFEMPEDNETELELINDFMNFIPSSFQPATVKDIMDHINERDKTNSLVFNEKFTEQSSPANMEKYT